MRFSWTFRHCVMATALAALALQGPGNATAQFAAGGAQNQPFQQYQQYQQYQQQQYQQQQQPYVAHPGYGQAQPPVVQPIAPQQQAPPQYTAMVHQVAPAGNGVGLAPQPTMGLWLGQPMAVSRMRLLSMRAIRALVAQQALLEQVADTTITTRLLTAMPETAEWAIVERTTVFSKVQTKTATADVGLAVSMVC